MDQIEKDIEWRLHRIRENDAKIALLEAQLLHLDLKNVESLREQELALRQQNVLYRREVSELRAKKAL